MPVLIEKGKIQFPYGEMTKQEKEDNENKIALDFIMDRWFTPYTSASRGGSALRPATEMDHKIRILQAATGSGKGSVGLELYVRYFEAQRKNIAVLQPTVATTVSIPFEVMEIPKYKPLLRIEENIGYQTGSFVRKPIKGIIFMTTGVIGQMLKVMSDEQFMRKFGFILLDEAHFRKVELDLVFFMLKKLVQRNLNNSECPFIIIMSATLPTLKYANYFGTRKESIIYVPGQTYPKEAHYLSKPTDNYIIEAVKTAFQIHNNEGKDDEPEKGDIIIFVYGAKPMKEIGMLVDKENEKLKNKIILTKIDATAFKQGSSEYFNVLKPLHFLKVKDAAGEFHTPTRRIVLGTPAVETGLTLSSLKYCIECGYVMTVQFNPIYNTVLATPKPVTQSMALQRIGRVGRKFPGVYHMMYEKEIFDALEKDQKPDMFTQDISDMLLNLIIADTMSPEWDKTFLNWREPTGTFDVQNIDLLDYPAVDSLRQSYEKLFILGLITHECKPTFMGVAATRFRSPLENIRMIFEGFVNGANVQDLIVIASILEADPTRLTNNNKMLGPTYKPRNIFGKDLDTEHIYKRLYISCDIIELLFAFYEIREQIQNLTPNSRSTMYLQNWMKENGLLYAGWLQVIEFRDSYMKTLVSEIGLNPYQNGLGLKRYTYDLRKLFRQNLWTGVTEVRKLKSAMFEGYRLSTATWDVALTMYVHDQTHMPINIKSPMLLPLPSHVRIKQVRPHSIIVFNMSLRLPSRSKTGLYEFGSYVASALDGFVNIDRSFVFS